MLVTIARYQAITGDSTTSASAVSARIEEAVELLEDELDRPLTSASRTERMHPTRDGMFLPHAIPITDGGDYTIDGYSLKTTAVWFPSWPETEPEGTEVTYTGGWVERTANLSATNRLPVCMERDIAWVAWALGHPSLAQVAAATPVGASSVRLGDAAVSYREHAAQTVPGEAGVRWSKRTLGYRYSRVGGYR